jgi:XTP/dITP diphosphohydrolase
MSTAPHSRQPPPRRVVLATANPGKAREITALLGDAWEVLLQSELGVTPAEETGSSFMANALLKARHAAAVTGLPAIADDSGLEVDALGGAPGVWSARYAGPQATDAENVARLLRELAAVDGARRAARFRCVVAFVRDADDPEPVLAEGAWEGRITRSPRGKAGFGYDPVFEDPTDGFTAAELPPALKNARSHRGQACRRLAECLGVLHRCGSAG